MSELNIDSNKGWEYKWEPHEDDIIRQAYPKNGYAGVLEFLPHRNKGGIQSRAKKLGVSYLSYDENYFENINTPEKAYWLGFMYTDGYVTSNNRWGIELSTVDLEHIENFTKSFNCNINIKIRDRNKSDKAISSCGFQINNSKMHNDLIKCGVVRNKTEILEYPNESIIDKSLYSYFIRGLFDGDGSIVFYTYQQTRKDRNNKIYNRIVKEITFVCKSENFIKKLQNIIKESCNVEFNLSYNSISKLPTLRLSKSKDLIKFIKFLYEDIENSHYLKRKYIKSQQILDYCLL